MLFTVKIYSKSCLSRRSRRQRPDPFWMPTLLRAKEGLGCGVSLTHSAQYYICRLRLYGRRQIRNHPDVGALPRGARRTDGRTKRTAIGGAPDRLSASEEWGHTLRGNVTQGKQTAIASWALGNLFILRQITIFKRRDCYPGPS